MAQQVKIQWLSRPDPHDFPQAKSYLSLLYPETIAARQVGRLRRARMTEFKAKDIFRASGLSLLGGGNFHVAKDRDKIKSKTRLSPILLVRDQRNGKVIVADGYHRLCAVYSFDEDATIPCKIV